MKPIRPPKTIATLLAGALLAAATANLPAQTDDEIVEAVRRAIQADRQEVVRDALQFTDTEASAFWPVYHQYRAEMDQAGNGIKALVLEYAKLYPDVPEERARKMLKELAGLEKRQVSTRAKYLKQAGKVLPAVKTLRFAQVESRLDLAVRLELAANIPLVPIPGQIAGRFSAGAVFLEGTAGGIYVQTRKITAKVAAIDAASRKVTLLSEDGIKQVVKVGPEAINFDQIRVGDQLRVTATEELVVQMGDKAEADGGAVLVALAPKGTKPGGLIAEAVQVIGTITALDAAKHTATLKFEDGTVKTLPVRADVDLSKRKVGEEVVIRSTEVLAITVEKP